MESLLRLKEIMKINISTTIILENNMVLKSFPLIFWSIFLKGNVSDNQRLFWLLNTMLLMTFHNICKRLMLRRRKTLKITDEHRQPWHLKNQDHFSQSKSVDVSARF